MTSWVAIVPFVAALLLGCATGVGETGGEETAAADTGTGVASCEDNAWIDFSLGIFRACGVHEDGCIECWGDVKADAVNDTGWTNYGLLEPPAVAARSVSVEASTIDDGEPAACVVASDGHSWCQSPLRGGCRGFSYETNMMRRFRRWAEPSRGMATTVKCERRSQWI